MIIDRLRLRDEDRGNLQGRLGLLVVFVILLDILPLLIDCLRLDLDFGDEM